MKRHLARLAVFCFVICSWAAPESVLRTNLTDAFAVAKAEQKFVLLNFTSPTAAWCQSCKNLEAEVCQMSDFQTYARTNFVFVVVDELRVQSPDGLTTIKSLEEKYAINSWPTLIVLDGKGEPLGRVVGYTKGTGCEKTIVELEKVRLQR
jgi:thioredoxin-related protein